MSLKDWKNKELNENLSKKWGFSMNLNLLKEQEEEQEKDEEEQEKDEKSDVMEEDMQASYDELQRLRALPNPTPQEQDTMDMLARALGEMREERKTAFDKRSDNPFGDEQTRGIPGVGEKPVYNPNKRPGPMSHSKAGAKAFVVGGDEDFGLEPPEGLSGKERRAKFQSQFRENRKKYNLEENQDRIFAPNHYCAHHVVHEGKEGYTVDHNWNRILKRVTRYDVKFADGSIKRNIHESRLTVLEAFTEGEHKRDDHPPVKADKNENKNMPKDRIRRDIEGDGQKLPKDKDGEIDWKKADEMAADIRQAKPETRLAKENIEEEAKPDFPDVDGDGNRKEPISKAQKDKKASGDKEEESDKDKSSKPEKGKIPPQFKKNMKESLRRKIRVKLKK